MGRGARLLTAMVWLCAGWSAAYWGLRWGSHTPPQPVPVAAHDPRRVDMAWVAKGLGAAEQFDNADNVVAAAPVAVRQSRVVLVGVATDAQGQGVALLGIDGQPAVAFRVGTVLPDGWVLRRLGKESAVLTAPDGQIGELTLALLPGSGA